jgi:hypothetical protein
MPTAIQTITRALKDIGALAGTETPTPDAAQDGLDLMNEIVNQWSNEEQMLFNVNEIVFTVIPGQTTYTIGPNPSTPNFIGSQFSGTIAGNILNVTLLTQGAISERMTLTGPGILPGTTITQAISGATGMDNATGTYKVSITQNTPASAFIGSINGTLLTVSSVTQGYIGAGSQITGTGITGNITIVKQVNGTTGGVGQYTVSSSLFVNLTAITGTITPVPIQAYYQKPLWVNDAFVRVNTTNNGQPIYNGGLDYPMTILAVEDYNQIGLKSLNGPWPKAVYFNANADSGNVALWPNPSQGEIHLFSSTPFAEFLSLTDEYNLPIGYESALRWILAERLMPMYGKVNQVSIAMIQGYAAQAKALLKRTNMRPQQTSDYADALLVSRAKDAGWILNGGFAK